MEILGKAKRVRIYVNEDDRVRGKPLHVAILELLRRENALGATVFRGVEGFGGRGVIHVTNLLDVATSLPVVVEWIDRPEAVERLVPRLRELVRHGLVTVEDTDIVHHEPGSVRVLAPTVAVRDVMTRDVAVVHRSTPIREVVELMLGKVYRAVPVVEDGRPAGLITSGDLVRRGGLGAGVELLRRLEAPEVDELLQRLSSEARTAGDVMTPAPVTVPESASLPDAAELMARHRLKRLPVVGAGGALTGIVSRVDLLRTVARGFARDSGAAPTGLAGGQPLSRAMRTDVPTLHPESPLSEAFQAVISTALDAALVVDHERRPVGLVTDAELLERVTPALRPGALRSLVQRLPFGHGKGEAAAAAHARARTAADVMSRDVATAQEEAPLAEAIATMLRGSRKVLAVTDREGRLVGIVDRADVLHGLIAPPG